MTGTPLLHATAAMLDQFELDAEARADIDAAIAVLDPKVPEVVGLLGSELGLPRAQWRTRGVAVVLMFTATQLADDLADNECTYLREPARVGPGAHWLLHQLFGALAAASSLSHDALRLCFADLAIVGSAQQLEVRRSVWDLESAKRAATGLNGRQWAAYLRLLAFGTSHAEYAPAWGEAWGIALHVSSDRRSSDPRFSTLSRDQQKALCAWALQRSMALESAELVTLRHSAVWFREVLKTPFD